MCQLLMLGGQEAKGCFWDLIEILRESPDYKIPLDKIEAIEYANRFPPTAINHMIQCDLIKRDALFIWSESLIDRMKEFDISRQKRVEAGRKGGLKKKQCSSNAKAMLKHGKSNAKLEEKRREEKNIVDKTKESPFLQKAEHLCTTMQNEMLIEKPDSKIVINKTWVTDMRLLLEQDHRRADEVEAVIKWVTHDRGNGAWPGWWQAVRSPGALRKQYDRLSAAMYRVGTSTLSAAEADHERQREILRKARQE